MKKKMFWAGMLSAALAFGMMVMGCVSGPASTSFVQGSGGDTTILLRDGLDSDQAFREIIFILNRHNFAPEMMSTEAGFIRTRWNTSWTENRLGAQEEYRVQIVVQFNPSRTQVIIQAPAERSVNNGRTWVEGYDRRAIETLRNDITQIIGN